MTKDVLRLTKDKETAKNANRVLNDSLGNSRKELTETKEKLVNCTKNYYELVEENKHLNKQVELYMNEKLFLFQVIKKINFFPLKFLKIKKKKKKFDRNSTFTKNK